MNRPSRYRQHALKLAVFFFCFAALRCNAVDRKDVMKRAHDSYYSLRTQGLLGFQSNIKPTWEVTLENELHADPAGAQAGLKLLNGLHFAMTLDESGKVKVDHSSDAPPPNAQAASGFDQIYRGMDQAVSGFFETWSMFMLGSPLPDVDSDYQLEDLGAEYRLSYKDGSANVVTSMSKDLVITEVKVTSPQFVSSIRPEFSRTSEGLVLAGYAGDYRPVSGPGVVKLDVKLDYQDVKGLQLPHRLNLNSVYDGQPSKMELFFSDYQVKTR
jgi:hypothetical protein